MRYKKQLAAVIAALLLLIGGAVLIRYGRQMFVREPAPPTVPLPDPQPYVPTESPAPDESSPASPDSFLLQVPFTPQAPSGNWDELHGEACEEASAIMAAAFFAGDTRETLPAPEVERQLDALTEWESKRFGYSLDTTAAETAEMIRSVYSLKTALITDFTEQDIRNALLDNKVIILPVDGRELRNPYFRQPGPIYHMLVIRGYTKTQLITNDPGTKRGENYPYTFTTLKAAAADWDHAAGKADSGRKVLLVVSK